MQRNENTKDMAGEELRPVLGNQGRGIDLVQVLEGAMGIPGKHYMVTLSPTAPSLNSLA